MSMLSVKGKRCAHCQKSVTEAMEKVPGAGQVTVDLEGGKAAWTGEASAEAMTAAIEGQGFEVVK